MKIPVWFLTASVGLVVTLLYQCSISDAAATGLLQHGNSRSSGALLKTNNKPNLIEALKDALKDRALIQSGPEDEPKPRKDLKKRRFVSKAESKSGKKDGGEPKGDLLRQELAKETQDNCLARLLCGVQPKPLEKPAQFTPINDYAYLVKEFFEIFGGPDPEDLKEEDEDKANDKGEDDDDDDENEARHSAEVIDKVNITGSIEEIVSTSTSATIDYVTTGATITDIPSNNSLENVHKVTLEELVGDVTATLTPDDVQSIRQARNLLKVGDLNKSSYIQKKISELRVAESDSKKIRIAGQIVNSIRQPRQCKQFSVAASEILSTCPLTTEVVRYFNANLKNGSQIALVKQAPNATEAGLVLLNDQANRPYAYFLDNSPIVANSKITTDLKNPTVPDRFVTDLEQQIYEYKPKPITGADQVSIAQPAFPPAPSKKSPSSSDNDDDEDGSNEEDDDEENGDEEEDDDERDNEEDEEDEEEEDQEDDVNDEEPNTDEPDSFDDLISNPEYQVRNYKYNNNIKKGGKDQQGRKWKVNKKPKKAKKKVQEQTSPKPGLPPGIIKVYGIPQPSFDNEFSNIAGQIGSGPVVIFDQDDYDDPHRGPPVQQPRPRPRQPVSTRPRNSYASIISSSKKPISSTKNNNKPSKHSKIVIKPKPTLKVASSEEEDEEDEDEDEEEDERSSRSGLTSSRVSSASVEDEEQQRGSGRPSASSHYMTSSYGVFPAPRAEEYYRNGIPPRPRPVIPSQTLYSSSADHSRAESSTQIRGRLNFRPNTPGSGLIRPAYYATAAQQAPSRASYFSY